MRSPDLSRGKIDPGPHASGVMFALFLAGARFKASRLPCAGADGSGRADWAYRRRLQGLPLGVARSRRRAALLHAA